MLCTIAKATMKEPTTAPSAGSQRRLAKSGARREYKCRKENRKHERIEEPINHFFNHAAVEGYDKGIIERSEFADSWHDQRTVSISEKEKIVDQTQHKAGKNAVIDDVPKGETPIFKPDK